MSLALAVATLPLRTFCAVNGAPQLPACSSALGWA
jgi:hypothetical protein